MIKKYITVVSSIILLLAAVFPIKSEGGEIRRLTYSGGNAVQYPSISDDGKWMLYTMDIKEKEKFIRSVRIMSIEDKRERELFRDGKRKAPPPFKDASLLLGSKPPVISGNGGVAVFSLSLGEPHNILDHYLAVVNIDGTDFWTVGFPFEALEGRDLKSLEFTSSDWERVSNYSVSSDGTRIACVLKGHLGPRRYGNPSGIVLLDTLTKKQRTILAPDFEEEEWRWSSWPRRPLNGGGWAFAISGNGKRLVFGARSSKDKNDYDLYAVDWHGKGMKMITDFHDRWFSMADISNDGKRVVFFYNGKKKQGIGTYVVNTDGSGLKHLKSRTAPRVEFSDMSGSGRYILFKHIYKGIIIDLRSDFEGLVFDEDTPGYATGLIPMDFPRFPAFWSPRIMNFKGDRALLVGPPDGKGIPEIYLLGIDVR